ncbi:MAG: hypothetical protein ACRDVC_07000 [Acidimicrobiales bacterium]
MSISHHPGDAPPEDAPMMDVMGSRETMAATTNVSDARLNGGTSEVVQETYTPGASIGLIFVSFLALLLSAWAGIVPYIGPTFGFSADGTSSWTWNDAHAYGALVPGAVGVVMCLLILASARRPMGMQSAGTLATAGFVVFLCGAWLTVTPVVWPVIVAPYFHFASHSMTLEYWLGYSSGPGLLLAGFGALVMGRSHSEAIFRRLTAA